MTMLPEAPAIVALYYGPDSPMGYARPSDGYGWFLIDRESRCLIHVRGPFETEEEALAHGRERVATRAVRRSDYRT
jgi:hypothetical protein